ncbi:MAG: hypothetical protein INQ03_23605 [Candidatus Heimdallarchaeota archaeon]|nr:hypothetical protein [Candidatus Heimdallarchaeota archaeon]
MTNPIYFDQILSIIRDVVGVNISGNLENWFVDYQGEKTDIFNLPCDIKQDNWKFDFVFIYKDNTIESLIFAPILNTENANFNPQMDVLFHLGISKENSLSIVQKFVTLFNGLFPFCTIRAYYTKVILNESLKSLPDTLIGDSNTDRRKLHINRRIA